LRWQPDSQQQQQQQAGAGSSLGQPQLPPLLLQPALGGFTTSLHTVYFDNAALQLYHGRLYLRPQTQTLKARWIGQPQGTYGSEGMIGFVDGWCPEKVVLERKIYREGWRGKLDG
jgi:SPX domain protein involved in polyphosphate accumulation